MKSYIYLFLSLILFTSCLNDDNDFAPQTEEDIIQYIENNNLNATRTDSGLYYVINNEGTGVRPTENSDITIEFKGYLLDGTVFSQSDSDGVSFALKNEIEGLIEGLQLFKEGGEGTLIIPTNLAYGSNGNGSIPGDAVVIFDIKLIEGDYAAQNDTDILKYIEDNNLNATKTDSGLYYVINNEGTGSTPTSTSQVLVAYKGYFLDGSVFDQSDSNGVSFGLDQVIEGWTEGITYFKEGGDGTLLVPYYLGYGINGYSVIPGGSILAFDINLINVN
jgi:FKBP-type peptidyl-prolyl cis-trans isomerase